MAKLIRMPKHSSRPFFVVTIFCLLLGVIGCQKAEEIVVHRVPKSQSELENLRPAPVAPMRPPSHAHAAGPSRMVVAIAAREQATWFFKVSGPVEQVNLTEPVWSEFFSEIKFADNGEPEWELPTGWSAGAQRSMRFATLLMNSASPPLEMSISSLGPNQDLVSNVNRWRGQLRLKPIGKDELDLKKISAGDVEMLLFDQAGLSGGGGMGGPPSVASEPVKALAYDTPDGWDVGPSNSMVQARLLKKVDDKKAQITVVEMPASANEWAPNVVRWAGEIGMGSIEDAEIEKRTTELSVGGMSGQQVRLIEEEDKYERATIAVMAKRGQSAWFFKVSGDKEIVSASEAEFEQFLKSIKFN